MKQPTSFFKFVSKDRLEILANGTIRFTQPEYLNDPFELNPVITHHTRDWLAMAEKQTEFSTDDIKFSTERFDRIGEKREQFQRLANGIVILSLSASYETSPNPAIFLGHATDPRRNLLMWTHYCEGHTGFAIEFAPEFMDGEAKCVTYTGIRPIYTFEEIENCSLLAYLQKSAEWAYENEWRFFKSFDESEKLSRDKIRLFRFNKTSVKSITFGCKASDTTKTSVISLLKSDPDYAGVATYFARINDQNFALDFHQEIKTSDRHWTNAPEYIGEHISIQRKPKGPE